MATFDAKKMSSTTWGIVAAGVVALIMSFFKWFGLTLGGQTFGKNGWGSGFLAVLALLLILVVTVAALVPALGVALPRMPVGIATALLGASALATLLLLLKLAVGYDVVTVSVPRRWPLYIALIASAVQTAFTYLAFRASGEPIPGRGTSHQTVPPPA